MSSVGSGPSVSCGTVHLVLPLLQVLLTSEQQRHAYGVIGDFHPNTPSDDMRWGGPEGTSRNQDQLF